MSLLNHWLEPCFGSSSHLSPPVMEKRFTCLKHGCRPERRAAGDPAACPTESGCFLSGRRSASSSRLSGRLLSSDAPPC